MRWNRWLASSQFRYLLAGGLFGLCFPIFASGFHLALHGLPFNLAGLIQSQMEEPTLWIVDTAPIFSGVFAWFAGLQRDHLTQLNRNLSQGKKEWEAVRKKMISKGTSQVVPHPSTNPS